MPLEAMSKYGAPSRGDLMPVEIAGLSQRQGSPYVHGLPGTEATDGMLIFSERRAGLDVSVHGSRMDRAD
jgi:hypothetical protein